MEIIKKNKKKIIIVISVIIVAYLLYMVYGYILCNSGHNSCAFANK